MPLGCCCGVTTGLTILGYVPFYFAFRSGHDDGSLKIVTVGDHVSAFVLHYMMFWWFYAGAVFSVAFAVFL